MSTNAWHIIMRLSEDTVIAPSPAARRVVARSFLRKQGAARLLAFSTADTHLHAVVVCSRAVAGEYARVVEITIQSNLAMPSGFSPAYLKPIAGQRHLENAVIYVLRQQDHHGFNTDPWHEGSSLSDALGLRHTEGSIRQNLSEFLPRLRLADLQEILKAPMGDWSCVVRSHLLEASLASIAGDERCSKDIRKARIAAVTGVDCFLSPSDTASILGVSRRMVERIRAKDADPSLRLAVRNQLALRAGRMAPTLIVAA